MVTRNDVTGDLIKTKANTKAYRDAYDAIFYKTSKNTPDKVEEEAPIDGTDSRSDIRVHD